MIYFEQISCGPAWLINNPNLGKTFESGPAIINNYEQEEVKHGQ